MKQQNLAIDLQQGVLPISAAAAHLAALIKQARSTGQPIIITQKGYPSGVILGVETFTALRELAERVEAEEEPIALPYSLHLPHPERCTVESVLDHRAESLVHIRFSFNGRDYTLDMPYTLKTGGRGYTWAGADLPGPTVWNGDQASRPLVDAEMEFFRRWCMLAEAELAE